MNKEIICLTLFVITRTWEELLQDTMNHVSCL